MARLTPYFGGRETPIGVFNLSESDSKCYLYLSGDGAAFVAVPANKRGILFRGDNPFFYKFDGEAVAITASGISGEVAVAKDLIDGENFSPGTFSEISFVRKSGLTTIINYWFFD